ncbi:MAG: tetratricopeptide repeat protein [Deltaproteobacteria bacterium]|nr:tetratricopeptide repeat protein [Deltaproteobacteria bacterium]
MKYLQIYRDSGGLDLFFKVNWSIAKLYQKSGSKKEAYSAFQKIVDTYNSLPAEQKEKLSAAGLASVAEAKFNLGERVLAEAHDIKLKLPEKVLADLLVKKVKLLISAVEIFNSVEEFGQPKWTIAAHARIGFGFQQLATDIENAPIPKNIPSEAQEIQRQELEKQAQPYWQRAAEEYRKCVAIAQQLKWFNEYSESAEQELAKIDPEFKTMSDIKLKPEYYTLNSVRPAFMSENEGSESPFKWGQADLETKLKEQTAHIKPSAIDFYNLGLFHEFNGKLREAEVEYKKALSLDQKFHPAVSRLGAIAFKEGNNGGAMSQFNRALEIDSMDVTARNYLAFFSFNDKKYSDAISHVRSALVSDPDDMNAYLNLIATYYEMGLHDLALLVVRNALAINPREPAIYNLAGLIYLKLGDVFSAVKNFLSAIENDAGFTDSHLNVGAITLNYKDYAAASAHLGAVKDRNLLAKMSLGVAERGLGKTDSVKAIYETIVRDVPNYPDVHFNMCLLYLESLSDYKSAKDECLKFLNMAPAGHPRLNDVQKKIKDIEVLLGATGE